MNQNFRYAREKLYFAMDCLVKGAGDINQRIEHAALSLHTLRAKDFPENLGGEFEKLWADLTARAPVSDEGTIAATARGMEPDAASDMADRIFKLYMDLMGNRRL